MPLSHTALWSSSWFCGTLLCSMCSCQKIEKICIYFFIIHPTSLLFHLIPSLYLVTVQVYLHQPAIRTTSTEPFKSAASLCSSHISPEAKISSSKAAQSMDRMVAPFTLPKNNCPSHSTYSLLDTPSYRSPIKSPSHNFLICYWSQI